MALCFFMSALVDGGMEVARACSIIMLNEALEKDEVFMRYEESRLGS